MARSKTSLRGLTLIEGLLFLGIAAIVIVGALMLFNNASQATKLNAAKTEIQAYVANIQSLFSAQPDYAGLDNTLVVSTGLAPAGVASGTDTLVNPWGGEVTIEAGSSHDFTIEYADVPKEACINIMTSGMANEGAITEIAVGTSTTGLNGNMTVGQANTACNTNLNDITFTAR